MAELQLMRRGPLVAMADTRLRQAQGITAWALGYENAYICTIVANEGELNDILQDLRVEMLSCEEHVECRCVRCKNIRHPVEPWLRILK